MSNILRTTALRVGAVVRLPSLVGPLLLLALVIALELPTPRFLRVGNPTPLILLLVVLAAFLGGARSGLISVVIAWVYSLYYFSIPGQPFHYTNSGLRLLLVMDAVLPVVAAVIVLLQWHAQRVTAALSNLPNRFLFMDKLTETIARGSSRCAILLLDLDRFKHINDSLGHPAGDSLLAAIAGRLESHARPGTTVARIGGDEYAVLLGEVNDQQAALRAADRIHEALAAPFMLDGHEVFITTSIGLVMSGPGTQSPEDLLRDADIALYHAKGAGGACVVAFNTGMRAAAVTLLRMENDLRRALERREILVYFQPIISLEDGQTRSAEALVRWEHPERGLVAPGEFLDIAERVGLLVPLSWWVLHEACREARTWGDGTEVAVSVNLASQQFAQPDLSAQVARVLRETGLQPARLHLEITEGTLIDNIAAAAETLAQLRALGVGVYLDDFGTGYSSLSYLHQFPIDVLKIDRSFIQGLPMLEKNEVIVRATIELAHTLRLEVVAEGVETAEQHLTLRRLGCDHGQGFLFGKPMDGRIFSRWLEEQLAASPQ